MPPPLAGLTVVAIEQAVAAPFATRQLADLGARVIKIERPDGGDFARSYDTTVKGLSSYFVWLNRGKLSLTLDLKRPDARVIVERLLARADVFVENLAPGAADRLGLAPADLTARYERLIACRVTGYGSTGPFAAKKAYDLLVQSETGVIDVTGTGDTANTPRVDSPGVQAPNVSDHVCASRNASPHNRQRPASASSQSSTRLRSAPSSSPATSRSSSPCISNSRVSLCAVIRPPP